MSTFYFNLQQTKPIFSYTVLIQGVVFTKGSWFQDLSLVLFYPKVVRIFALNDVSKTKPKTS